MAVLYDCAAAGTFTRSAYNTAVRRQLPILFLPADDIASRRVSQHQLSFLLTMLMAVVVHWVKTVHSPTHIGAILDESFQTVAVVSGH